MSVVDDIKNSFKGSDNSSSSGRDSGGNDFDSSFDDSSFDDIGGNDAQLDPPSDQNTSPQQGRQDQSRSTPSGNQNSLSSPSGNRNQNSRSQRQAQNQNSSQRQGRGSNVQGRRGNSSPNAQAGSPQQGSSQPQLSSQTRKKMDNAGLNTGRGSQGGRNRNETVSDSRDDFEELKSQNEQIIELLKRINRNLEQLGR